MKPFLMQWLRRRTGETINTETAKKGRNSGEQSRKRKNEIGTGFCVAVVGPSGDLVYFEKQDNCQFASTTISQHKARTAARYRRPTVVFLERLLGKGDFFAYLTTLDDVIASRGGNPLMAGEQGHRRLIGVSGGAPARRTTSFRRQARQH